MDYSIILDFGDEPVKTVDEKLDILRFDYSWAEAVQAEEEEEERKKEIEGMGQMPILGDGAHQYTGEIRSGLIARMKDTAEIQEKLRNEILGKVHKDLMASVAKRDQNLYKEAVAKIERQNEIKMLDFLETQKEGMRRRNQDVAKMLMNNLRQHNTILAAVHEELIIRVEKKDEMKKIRANILTEMMMIFKRMAEVEKTRAVTWIEMMKKTRKETLLHTIFVHLVKKVMRRRNPDVAKMMMNNLRQHNAILVAVHEELIIRVEKKDEIKKRRANMLSEMMMIFKRMSQVEKTKVVTWMEMMKKTRKETLLHTIFVHLVKEGMRRRNPDVAKMMMNNLRQHNAILAAVHEELIIRVEKKDELEKIRANILTEMMLRFKRMAEAKKTRAVIWMEMMREIRNRQQLPHIQSRTSGYEKVLDHILEKPDVDDEFVPRKLFLFGVDTFNFSPKHEGEPSTDGDQNLTAVIKNDESLCCLTADSAVSSMDKANDQGKPPRRTLRDRVKKFLGIK